VLARRGLDLARDLDGARRIDPHVEVDMHDLETITNSTPI
jgi:hypothetical protein